MAEKLIQETAMSGEAARQAVMTYLQTVLSAFDTVLDESSSLNLTTPDLLLDHIARKLLKAFSPFILTESPPPSLAMEVVSKKNEDDFDSDDDNENNNDDTKRIQDRTLPCQNRRIDYLRCILRGMAPIAIDVVAIICSLQPDLQTLVILFGTWLPLAPHVTPLVSFAFDETDSNPFANIENAKPKLQWHLLEALHSILRHFSYEQGHQIMSRWWSWAPLFTILQLTSTGTKALHNCTAESLEWSFEQATRWHAARAIAYLFDMSPGTMASFLKRLDVYAELVPWILHPWILHQEEVEWEVMHQKGMVRFLEGKEVVLPNALQVRSCLPLNSSLIHVGEGLVFPKEQPYSNFSPASSIVVTATTQQNIALVGAALAFEELRPILLAGPTASGKSSLVRYICTSLGKSLLELHVDDDTDSKTLIGSYQTADIPGEFTWQPGALTRAVRTGSWVLLEDLDTVPLEIQAALIPLLEQRCLPVGSAGEREICHPNFRLFATLSTNSRRQSAVLSPRLWRKVCVQPLALSEWKEISKRKYPKMPDAISSAALNVLEQCLDRKTTGRPAAVRDFLKLLSRISNSVEFGESNNYITEVQRTICLAETLDVFSAHSPDLDQIRGFASRVAAPAWGVTTDSAFNYLFTSRPELIQTAHMIRIGRAKFHRTCLDDSWVDSASTSTGSFASTDSALRLMESVLVCVRENEPTLLVGETGCGKTTILQKLAQISNHTLIVQNLSLQTDSTDLLGGYRPLEITHIARTIYLEFVELFVSCFSRRQNADFLNFASSVFQKNHWKKLSQCLRRAAKLGLDKMKATNGNGNGAALERWQRFAEGAERFERQRLACETKLAFSFTEGALVDAIRTGKWVLLDEINLASSETLQRLCGLLDDGMGSVTLTERGDAVAIARHPDFRLFAAMNPATDAGKKDLPDSIRSRFTEIYVNELRDPNELRTVAGRYLAGVLSTENGPIEHSETVVNVVSTFLAGRDLASKSLVDASGQRPRYTLRTLCRALIAAKTLIQQQRISLKRGILEGFEMAFEGPLQVESLKTLKTLLQARLGRDMSKEDANRPGRRPGGRGADDGFVLINPFWITRGPIELQDWSAGERLGRAKFILTSTMTANLRRLSRAVAAGPWPVLLEGPTSAGKTTLVEYLAARCGHKVVRINNHEHTDVQEYTGSYASDENGSLSFRDGILVQALRKGHWVILDELNLAPSEVLEALNRLLDDNRELYLAEINEIVRPHPNFRLFATQNPCGAYGGRKPLSRAFRNRFVEIHMGDIPGVDMVTILEKRSGCPSTHAKLLVSIMTSLRQRRSKNGVFLGKDGLITPRDLLRWAERRASSKVELAEEGFMLLGERLRSGAERDAVREEIENRLNVSVSCEDVYYGASSLAGNFFQKTSAIGSKNHGGIAPTRTILRLLSLVLRCIKQREPVLLVGDTGCGKTTVVQLLSTLLQRELKIVNCHATTETSDLIGGLRPVRGRVHILSEMCDIFRNLVNRYSNESLSTAVGFDGLLNAIDTGIENLADDFADRLISVARVLLQHHENVSDENLSKKRRLDSGNTRRERFFQSDTGNKLVLVTHLVRDLERLHRSYTSLFEWVDGSLVQAMKKGHLFLLDEMSLAEDAVLERLNSVLEQSRTIVLAEKGDDGLGDESHVIEAHPDFLIFATMNPGGDFGKRELSPALRSRFTEIWVPNLVHMEDVKMVLDSSFTTLSHIADVELVKRTMLSYVEWFNTTLCADPSSPCSALTLSLRDVLTWGRFVTEVLPRNTEVSIWEMLCHGASLMHLDGLGLGTGLSREDAELTRTKAALFLLACIPTEHKEKCQASFHTGHLQPDSTFNRFGINPFSIPSGSNPRPDQSFNFQAPTTASNLLRTLRAMQLFKPILLEGSPGVGKTSLISALAKAAGYNLVRINLSEQTDISDLMGSDLPMPDGDCGEDLKGSAFRWCDGVLLRAIKNGDWVLLDELNLATQSVLEGLNSCLDHRACVFIPELGETFRCPPTFRIFAAQNPLGQGGGRKGLPKSFLNRFTKVYVEALNDHDLQIILESSFSNIPMHIRAAMINFNSAINVAVVKNREYGDAGSPWEFNLRDVFRWCELAERCNSHDIAAFGCCARDLYLQRFRSSQDREQLIKQFTSVFNSGSIALEPLDCAFSDDSITIGSTSIPRFVENADAMPQIGSNFTRLRSMLLPMEAISRCVVMNWPCLIVGPAGSGKTSLLKCLACYLNVKLVDICLTHSTDVNELIGSFEQVDTMSDEKELVQILRATARRFIQTAGCSADDLEVAAKVYRIYEDISSMQLSEKDQPRSVLIDPATVFLQLIQNSMVGYESCVPRIELLLRRIREREDAIEQGGRFCWVDGILVEAMVNGYWLHLENVNLCSSSVLDRLNPVMEPGGELLLTETGTQGSGTSQRVIKPHRNFRLFLSMNPDRGEVSRAMRNRCVEVSLLARTETRFVDESDLLFTDRDTVDQLDVLSRNGIRTMGLVTSLLRMHQTSAKLSLEIGTGSTSLECPRLMASGFRGLRSRGLGFKSCFESATLLTYDAKINCEAALLSTPRDHNTSINCWHTPMIPGIRENWSLHPGLSGSLFDAHLMHCVHPSLPPWLRRFRSAAGSTRESELNEICEGTEPSPYESELIQMQCLVLYLCAACNDSIRIYTQSSLLDHFSFKYERILDFFLRKLSLIDGSMLSSFVDRGALIALEHHARKQADLSDGGLINSGECNVFDVSYWLYSGKIERSLVPCPVTPAVFVLFEAIDAWSGVLEDRARHLVLTIKDEHLINQLRIFFRVRDQFWIFFKRAQYRSASTSFVSFDETRFVVHWTWFKKALLAIDCSIDMMRDEDLLTARRRLDSLIGNIDRVLLDGDGSYFDLAGDLLWKKGGHPLVPAKSCHWQAIVDIRKACVSSSITNDERFNSLAQTETTPISVDELIAMQHAVLFLEVSTKQELLDSLCMSHYSYTEELNNQPSSKTDLTADFNVVCKEVEDARAAFIAAWKAAQVDRSICTVENMFDVEMLEQLQMHLHDGPNENKDSHLCRQIMKRFADVQISPIVEIWLIHTELQLISDVSTFLMDGVRLATRRKIVTASARRFVQVALSCPVWPVADLRPYQTLVWAFDSDANEVELFHFLKSILFTLLHLSSNHLWRNTFNHLDVVSPILEYPLQWSTSKRVSTKPSEGWQTIVGPSRVWEHVRTDTVLRLVGPEFSAALIGRNKAHYLTLENHEVREMQSKALIGQLSTFRTEIHEPRFPFEVVYLFTNVLEALDEYFPGNKCAIMLSILRKGRDLKATDVDALHTNLRLCTHSRFNECRTSIVSPLILRLTALVQTGDGRDIAMSWILIGLLRVHLLVPQSPLDPGQKPIAKTEQLQRRLSCIQSKIAAFRLDKGLKLGNFSPSSELLADWESEARNTLRKKASQEKKMVERVKQTPPFLDLFRAIRRFWKATANPSVVISITDALESPSQSQDEFEVSLRREQNWQNTAASFCNQMTTHFNSYEDVVLPFVVAVQCIQRGLRELRDYRCGMNSPGSAMASHCIANLIRFPFQVDAHHIQRHSKAMIVLTQSSPCKTDIGKKCALALSLSALTRYGLQKRASGFLASYAAASCISLFEDIVKSWLKFVDRVYVKDLSDDAEQERMYREQFPDHNRDFIAFTESTGEDESDVDVEEGLPLDVVTEMNLSDDIISFFYELYREIFSDSAHIDLNTARILSFQISYGGAHLFRRLLPKASSVQSFKEAMGPHCLAVALSCDGRSHLKSTMISSKSYSFHNDPNAPEVRKASAPLQNLLSRTTKLLTAFPGHEILLALGQVAEFVRKLELTSTSVGKAMTGLEVVLRKAQEWEEHASERVKLGSCLAEISHLVASWRKLELTSWASLLDSREERSAKRGRRHWMRLFSVLNCNDEEERGSDATEPYFVQKLDFGVPSPPWIWRGTRRVSASPLLTSNLERLDSLIKLLDSFMLTSCIGEFQERIGLFKSFAYQLMAKPGVAGQSLFVILTSLGSYYSQFLPLVLARRDVLRSPIEAKLKDEVKLAKWDEHSYYALVDSTERNHRKLMKLLREYDEVLEVSVSSLLEQSYNDGIRASDSTGGETSTTVPSNKQMFPMIENFHEGTDSTSVSHSVTPGERIWESAQNVGLASDKFIRKMVHFHKTMIATVVEETRVRESWAQIGSQRCTELCLTVFDRIHSLRKENSSRQMKQRAVTDMFKVLKKNGFMSTKWSIPPELREMKHVFHLPVPSECSLLLSGNSKVDLASANDYFQRCLLEVQRLHSEVLILGSRHLTLREMELMTNLGSHGLLLIAQQRTLVAECLGNVPRLKAAVESMAFLERTLPLGQSRLQQGVREFDVAFNSAGETLGQLELLVSSTLKLGQNKDSMRDTVAILDHCVVLMNRHRPKYSGIFITPDILRRRHSMIQCLEEIKGKILECHNLCCVKEPCVPGDPFEACIAAYDKAASIGSRLDVSDSNVNTDSQGDERMIDRFLSLASKGVQSTLVVVQNLLKNRYHDLSKESGMDEVDEVTIWEAHRRMCQEWDTLDVGGLTNMLVALANDLVAFHESDSITERHRSWLVSVAADVGALVEPVLELSLSRLLRSIAFFRNSSKFLYVLVRIFRTLVAKGYCSDKKSEDNDGEGEGDISGMKFEDDVEGTGMGEGDGKEDVTDQLESEEQLLGLKNDNAQEGMEKSQDPTKLDEEEAKRGMEMEADFDGEMFDVPDDKEEAEGEDDKVDELDREMGDGTDENEEVVDEKMWGDSDDDDDIDHAKEMFEKDSKVKGEGIDEEMRTKDDDEGENNPEGSKSEPQAQTKEDTPVGDVADDQDHAINEDLQDNYEDKHQGVDVRNDDDGKADVAEDMELEDEVNFNENDNDGEGTDDEEIAKGDDEVADETTADSDVKTDGQPEDEDEFCDDNEIDDVRDTGAVHEGAAGQPEDEISDDDKEHEPEGPRVDMARDEGSRQEAFGVKAREGADNIKDHVNDDDVEKLEEEGRQGDDQNNGSNNDEKAKDLSSGSGGNLGSGGEREDGFGVAETPLTKEAAPNPFKNPGDAAKFWHKKLKMVENEQDSPNDEDVVGNNNEEAEGEARNECEHRYAAENEGSESQVLGETTDEITTAFEDKRAEGDFDMSDEPVDDKSPSALENQTSERTTPKWSSKPILNSSLMNDNPDDENSNSINNEREENASLSPEVSDKDEMETDSLNTTERRNEVVSDLAQVQVVDDTIMVDQGKIIEEDEVTGMNCEEEAAARLLWNTVAGETHNLARRLCEKLRLVMEPLLATKLKGDYRTGKRINMKKVIGYVASGYRKDKIWLRRTKPAKRNYRVLLAVDNSESMRKSGAGDMALAAMATLAVGMSQLEIGELGIASFGDDMRLLHPFHLPFTLEAGPGIVHSFPFDEKRTRTALCVASALAAMDTQGDHAAMQLMFIISDGRIERDSRSSLRRLMREMVERNILLVMIVVEGNNTDKKKRDSIVHMKEVSFEDGKPIVKQFMEEYPFPYYIILEDMQSLPEVLGDALRQWFEMIAQLQQG